MAVTDKFDISALALKSMYPKNHILMDDQNLPSVMVYIPKFSLSDVIDGASDDPHPAFIVNGEEIDGFYFSKFMNIVHDGRAYSLPNQAFDTATIDDARDYCESKGDGWHMMSEAEWSAIALWCQMNGTLPSGNACYGKEYSEDVYVARPTEYNSAGYRTRTATGTGPLKWNHNWQADGIADMKGNNQEWTDGMRLVYGELQILANNNSADSDNDKSGDSEEWMAVNGLTGELTTPDGSGTTENCLRLNYVSGSTWTWITGSITVRGGYTTCSFCDVTADTDVCDDAKELLYALNLLPTDDYDTTSSVSYSAYTSKSQDEALCLRGGTYGMNATAGIFHHLIIGERDVDNFAFRCAYYDKED